MTIEKIENTGLPDPSNWHTNDISVEIYRSINGGQEFYLVSEQFFGPNPEDDVIFADGFSDSTIQNNLQIYTPAGVPDNDPPPRCKYVHSVNNFTYYAHIKEEDGQIFPSLIRQSQAKDPDSGQLVSTISWKMRLQACRRSGVVGPQPRLRYATISSLAKSSY